MWTRTILYLGCLASQFGGLASRSVAADPTPVRIVGATYPRLANLAHAEGEVHLAAQLSSDGSVQSVTVVSGPGLLREAARQALLKWRFLACDAASKECDVEIVFRFVLTRQQCEVSRCQTEVQVDLPSSITIRSESARAMIN